METRDQGCDDSARAFSSSSHISDLNVERSSRHSNLFQRKRIDVKYQTLASLIREAK
jgi:hypothetical protein